ncbi:MAG: DUF1573 domain-containing protein [Candidatus Levybacteria bacterium]|nr:DUF1573 domain-containing protein [Candidatus Levybacteria bacterium]
MDKKILIGLLSFSLLIIVGGAFVLSNGPTKAVVEKTQGAKLETKETSFDFKEIPYSGGKAEHAYLIKNTGNKDLEIANISTSCMCTIAYFKSEREMSSEFGMKGMTQPSSWKGILKAQEEGKIVIVFDPAFHGPQGVGPISRIVSFETNDPDNPYAEFAFSGTVVK